MNIKPLTLAEKVQTLLALYEDREKSRTRARARLCLDLAISERTLDRYLSGESKSPRRSVTVQLLDQIWTDNAEALNVG